MEAFSALFDGLSKNLPIAMLTIALVVIGWLAKALISSYDEKGKALQAAHDAHLQTAMQVAPLAQKLVTCVEVLERLSARVGGN